MKLGSAAPDLPVWADLAEHVKAHVRSVVGYDLRGCVSVTQALSAQAFNDLQVTV